jgi:anti-sigma factor RsiW
MDTHRMTLLGADTLGLLDAAERRELDEHLAVCAACRTERAELARVAATLRRVPPHLIDAPTDPADDLLLRRTLRVVRAERAAHNRSRLTAVAASVITVFVVSAAVGLGLGARTDSELAVRRISAADTVTGVRLQGSVTPAKGWVRLDVVVDGVKPGQRCRLVAVSATGAREIAGSWVVSGRDTSGRTNLSGAAAVPVDDLLALEVVTDEGTRLLTVEA